LGNVATTGQETFVAFGISKDRDQLILKIAKILGQTLKYLLRKGMAGPFKRILMRDESRSSSQVTGRTRNRAKFITSFT
jgi:hypothetical protein